MSEGDGGSTTDSASAPVRRRAGGKTAATAAGYTMVAAVQKASGFLLLITFTRVLTPTEYGQVALLTTVGTLLMMVLTLGLEPRITYMYFRAGDGLNEYLRLARRASLLIPMAVAVLTTTALALSPIALKQAWITQCLGSCLLAAGTTYSYAVLRASRRVKLYALLAFAVLLTQVAVRVAFVPVLGRGPEGWAAGDLAGGVVAILTGQVILRRGRSTATSSHGYTWWRVVREGLPLVPHYLAQWGLSLSDRLVLALFVMTAEVGIYSAIYQIAAVTSLLLNEINRAFMPLYAQHQPGAARIASLVRTHIAVSCAVHTLLMFAGFATIELVLPPAYREHADIYPLLALGALAYGLYFIPMNALTLVAGRTSPAPLISLSALTINLALNLSLDSIWGLWGAVVATALGYGSLLAIAAGVEARNRSIPWGRVLGGHRFIGAAYVGVVVVTVAASWGGVTRLCSLALLTGLATLIVTLAWRSRS